MSGRSCRPKNEDLFLGTPSIERPREPPLFGLHLYRKCSRGSDFWLL